MSHVYIGVMSHVTCLHTSHVTCHMSHVYYIMQSDHVITCRLPKLYFANMQVD
jgi:hypothetical protein